MNVYYFSGQMCNVFWLSSRIIAECIQYDKKVIIWCPNFDYNQFPNFRDSSYIKIGPSLTWLISIFGLKRVQKYIYPIFANKYAFLFLKGISKIVPNFNFYACNTSDSNNIGVKRKEYRKSLVRLFTPSECIISQVEGYFPQKKNPYTIFVGIHIRRGDYKYYQEGKYYFSIQQYVDIMHGFVDNCCNDKVVVFFISSNEKIDLTVFNDLKVFQIGDSSPVKDLVGLSMCDYIIGPPSTYSAWASIYHDVQLYWIENPKKNIIKSDFFKIGNIWDI